MHLPFQKQKMKKVNAKGLIYNRYIDGLKTQA